MSENTQHTPGRLEPPDTARCQAETITRTPFALGGTHRVERCQNQPSVIAKEAKAGPDGLRGSMSLCADCKAEFLKKMGDGFATFKPIRAVIAKATKAPK